MISPRPCGGRTLPLLLLCCILASCVEHDSGPELQESMELPGFVRNLEEIREDGRLTALTRYNGISYFIYRGQPMGFDYDLLKLLTDHLGLQLEVVVPKEWGSLIPDLISGKGDMIAYNMTITKERSEQIQFLHPHILARQVLVQKKPDGWRRMSAGKLSEHLVSSPLELIGKTVHVREHSSYRARLENLGEELGADIGIEYISEEFETEDIIAMVAGGEIDYTLADENLAGISQSYYSGIDVSVPVSFRQRIAWAVRKKSSALEAELNKWMDSMIHSNDPTFNILYKKYFSSPRSYKARVDSPFFSRRGDRISEYDSIFRKYSARIGWDWRLLASIAWHESRFNPSMVSWAGATGLMQVMPHVGEAYGETELFDPEKNLATAVELLAWLKDYWAKKVTDEDELIKFVLGSYNVGQGHVLDASRLAEKYGSEGNVWDDNTADFLLMKSQKKYFMDKVATYGYCRGQEPYDYVRNVLTRFRQYQEFIPE